ncbi:hypothetical protein K466DRAFT_239208 [Polyporus arcularius HHB13444]|uniref:Secreted protein n=1 Tax=Polyporus arcularius HHB13444 TaxID=1314778 RepID=A0A5C3P705_9APHY|nr:hypothetical protein K466DRAFT_239208 [Polyporus arcularius HHB13444]
MHARARTSGSERTFFCFLCVFSSISYSSLCLPPVPSPAPAPVHRPPSTLIISVWTSCLPRLYLLPLDIVCIPLCSAPPPSPVSRRSLLVYVARGTSASITITITGRYVSVSVSVSAVLSCACRWGVRSLT